MNTKDEQRIAALSCTWGDPAFETALRAWIESKTRRVVPPGTVLYLANYITPRDWDFSLLEKVAEIGRHLFYREKR